MAETETMERLLTTDEVSYPPPSQRKLTQYGEKCVRFL